jgi:hypothetical protein
MSTILKALRQLEADRQPGSETDVSRGSDAAASPDATSRNEAAGSPDEARADGTAALRERLVEEQRAAEAAGVVTSRPVAPPAANSAPALDWLRRYPRAWGASAVVALAAGLFALVSDAPQVGPGAVVSPAGLASAPPPLPARPPVTSPPPAPTEAVPVSARVMPGESVPVPPEANAPGSVLIAVPPTSETSVAVSAPPAPEPSVAIAAPPAPEPSVAVAVQALPKTSAPVAIESRATDSTPVAIPVEPVASPSPSTNPPVVARAPVPVAAPRPSGDAVRPPIASERGPSIAVAEVRSSEQASATAQRTTVPRAPVVASSTAGLEPEVVPGPEPASRPAGAARREQVLIAPREEASSGLSRIARPPIPDIEVVRTAWHPDPERRSARLRLMESGELVTLSEGDAAGALVIKEITPSSVLFSTGEIEIRRRVGD